MARAARSLAIAVLLAAASPAAAAGWTPPAPVPSGAGMPVAGPVVGATSDAVVVVAWRRGRAVVASARYLGGPWSRPRVVAVAGDSSPPAMASRGGTAALAVASGTGRGVRVLRWTRGLSPAADGPRGAGAYGVRLAVLPSGEMVVVARRGTGMVWSARRASGGWTARPRRGPWSPLTPLVGRGAAPALATDPEGTVLAVALRPSRRGTVVRAALRRPGEPFGPRSTVRPLGPRWRVTTATPAIRPDGRTALVMVARDRTGRGAVLATVAGAAQRPLRVSAPGVVVVGPVAARIRAPGGLVAVWRESAPGGTRLVAAQEVDADGTAWTSPVALTRPGRVGAPELARAPDGRTMLVYASGGAVRVRTLPAGGGPAGWSAPRTLSGRRSGCASPSLAFDADRKAVVVFTCAGGRRLLAVSER